MFKYAELCKIVNEYLESEDVALREEVISLKDLRNIISERFKKINSIKYNKKKSFFAKNKITGVKNILNKEDGFCFYFTTNTSDYLIGPVFKKYGFEGINYDLKNKESIKVVESFMDELLFICDELEGLREIPSSYDLRFNDDLLNVCFSYYSYNEPDIRINFKHEAYNKYISKSDLLPIDFDLMLGEKKERLFAKIPVNVCELPFGIQELIGDYLRNNKLILSK